MTLIELRDHIIDTEKILYIHIVSQTEGAQQINLYFANDKIIQLDDKNMEATDFLKYLREKMSVQKLSEVLNNKWSMH